MSVTTQQPIPAPIRACTSWCTAAPHEAQHPHDRSCWSDFLTVTVCRRPPVKMRDDTWALDWLDLALLRPPKDPEPVLLINDEGKSWELELTLTEARQLVSHINSLLALDET